MEIDPSILVNYFVQLDYLRVSLNEMASEAFYLSLHLAKVCKFSISKGSIFSEQVLVLWIIDASDELIQKLSQVLKVNQISFSLVITHFHIEYLEFLLNLETQLLNYIILGIVVSIYRTVVLNQQRGELFQE